MKRIHLILFLITFLFTSTFATAADEAVREFTPRVARISYLEGPVTMQRTTDESWTDAALNLPLLVGDKIYTGIGGRVELQLDDETVIRLDNDSYIHFANLEDTLTRIGILKGSVAVHAQNVPYKRAPVEIQSQNFLAAINDWGHVRFNIRENGPAEVLVRRGSLDLTQGDKDVIHLGRGEQVRIDGPTPNTRTPVAINPEDSFDQWGDMRDAMLAASPSRAHLTTRIAGYDDMDRYGEWVDIPSYGTIWRPYVTTTDWAPYRDGRWVWFDSCGWTWVSSKPWGWAPYHYGRWVYVDHYNWCWVPHTEIVHVSHYGYPRPVWYPALVSFTYSKHGSSFSFAIGGGWHDEPCVGWFPLGPRDPFYWHRPHHPDVVININIHDDHRGERPGPHDNHEEPHRYDNEHAPNAVTVVSERDFEQGSYDKRAAAQLQPNRTSEVAVGENAIQQIEQVRTSTSRGERGNTPQAGTQASGKPDAGRNGTTSPMRAPSASSKDNSSPRGNMTPATTDSSRDASGKTARTEDNRNTPASVSPQRDTTSSTRGERQSVLTPMSDSSKTSASSNNTSTPRRVETRPERSSLIHDSANTTASTPRDTGTSNTSATRAPRTATSSSKGSGSSTMTSPDRSSSYSDAPLRAAAQQSDSSQNRAMTTRPDQSSASSSRSTSASPSRNSTSGNSSASRQEYSAPRSSSASRTDARSYYTPSSTYNNTSASRTPSYSTPRSYSPSSTSYWQNTESQRTYSPRSESPTNRSQGYSTPSSSGSTSPSRGSQSSRSTSQRR